MINKISLNCLFVFYEETFESKYSNNLQKKSFSQINMQINELIDEQNYNGNRDYLVFGQSSGIVDDSFSTWHIKVKVES